LPLCSALLTRASSYFPQTFFDIQACAAAYDKIEETTVYNCTGNPHPDDIKDIVDSMMADDFGTAYKSECTRFEILGLFLF